MTKNESLIIMALFFSQHEGKRLSDVIPNAKPFSVIHSFDGGDICDETGHLMLWCSNHSYGIRMQITTPIGQDVKIVTINLLDYISFEDLI